MGMTKTTRLGTGLPWLSLYSTRPSSYAPIHPPPKIQRMTMERVTTMTPIIRIHLLPPSMRILIQRHLFSSRVFPFPSRDSGEEWRPTAIHPLICKTMKRHLLSPCYLLSKIFQTTPLPTDTAPQILVRAQVAEAKNAD